jgi:hypothetical protein
MVPDDPTNPDDIEGAPDAEEAQVDEALRESFPASDPPSWTLGVERHGETLSDSPPTPDPPAPPNRP